MSVSKSLTAIFAAALVLLGVSTVYSQINTLTNGGFESAEVPGHWQKIDAADAEVIWDEHVYRSPERSLKISESAGADAPAWQSSNLATLNWNPTSGVTENIEIEVGGWVKTENVNTNPANADAEIHLVFTFKDAAGGIIFNEPVVLKIPQDQAGTDWVEIKNDVPIVLPVPAAELIISFAFGANATGTAWLDDIFMRLAEGAEGWIGDLYNANFGVPEGWFFWKDRMSLGDQDYGVVSITSNAAHSGNYSLRIGDTADNPAEVVAISNRQPIEPGRSYGLSAWVKLAGVNVNPKREVETAVFFTVTYHTDAADWAEVGGEDFFVVDQSSSDCDWRLYQFTFTPPAEATRISVRARMQHQTVGDTYWDDFRIYPVEVAKQNYTFDESLNPAYWNPYPNGDALVEWASDQYRSAERSLKIYDSDGDDDPCWVSGNLAKLNWNSPTGLGKNIEMLVGGWVKTENVNINPADAASEIRLTFSFFDAEQNLIFGEPVVLKVPQTQASVDWTEIKNDVPIVLPVEADSLVVMFSFGANATGTAWLDDIFMYPAPGASGWIGDLFNANFGTPAGWSYWKSQMSEGVAGKGVVSITETYAHSGKYSLRVADDDTNGDEVVAMSDRTQVEPNTEYLIGAWVKLDGVNPLPVFDVEKAIFFTVTFHSDAEGWAETHGADFFVVNQTEADRDWALCTFRLRTEENDRRISIRARMQHWATGDVYWDDFFVVPIAQTMAGNGFENAEMPAYWTKANEGDATLSWDGQQFRSPQRSLMIQESAGDDDPMWVTHANMAKLQWNPVDGVPPDIEIEVGGWVKTENLNTAPASDAEKVVLTWEFFDAEGALIFGEPIVLEVPQNQGTIEWTEIKNDVPIVLPVTADSLAIKFHFGANAVGTVWLDDIFMRLAEGAEGWIGDLYNANFGVPEGWFFWKDRMSLGDEDYGVVTITRDEAFTGDHSLLISDTADNPAEVVAISDRNPIEGNKVYTVQAWVKTEEVILNPENDVEKSVFFTTTYHTDDEGWAEFAGEDFFVVDQTVASKDWSLYVFTLTAPADAKRMSIRARLQHQATGKVYWDDFAVVEGNVTRVDGQDIPAMPQIFALEQNYPNPFNPTTTICFNLPQAQQVSLVVYDLLGKTVRTLADGMREAGEHTVTWDGRDDNGLAASSGIYFYTLTTPQAKLVRKMTFIK